MRGNGLFFVRRPSACGLGDTYFTRLSNRAGGKGSQDIWVATRDNGGDGWSQPENLVNLGDQSQQVNTSASETRPSLSWSRETLSFGRSPAAGGPGDVYATKREKAAG